jgi:Fe-S-cluster containining protein
LTTTEIKLAKKFEKGIYFSCQMCGVCCKGLDEGEVYLYEEDIKRLVKFLKLTNHKTNLKDFAKNHLKITKTDFYWNRKKYNISVLGFKFVDNDEHCEFLDVKTNQCLVYDFRPFQCRAFPIGWNMLINSYWNFTDYSKKCPGLQRSLKNKGEFYSKEEILYWAKQEYEIERRYFLKMKRHNYDIFKVYKFLPNELNC